MHHMHQMSHVLTEHWEAKNRAVVTECSSRFCSLELCAADYPPQCHTARGSHRRRVAFLQRRASAAFVRCLPAPQCAPSAPSLSLCSESPSISSVPFYVVCWLCV